MLNDHVLFECLLNLIIFPLPACSSKFYKFLRTILQKNTSGRLLLLLYWSGYVIILSLNHSPKRFPPFFLHFYWIIVIVGFIVILFYYCYYYCLSYCYYRYSCWTFYENCLQKEQDYWKVNEKTVCQKEQD